MNYVKGFFITASCLLVALGGAGATQETPASISADNIGLSGKDFFRVYTSSSKQDSETARLYMLGVSDAGEGRDWCDYKRFSTATLQEFIYEFFKKLPERRYNERAATLIQEALKINFPCKDKK
jgi:hypothetical protein